MDASIPFRSYPYAKPYWTDQEGYSRISLTLYHSTILTALISLLISYTLGCLLLTANFLLNFYLYRSVDQRTILDDQVNVLSANANSPSGLLLSLLHLFVRRPGIAARSKDFLLTLAVGMSFYTLQIYSIVWPGIIFRADPVPYSPGTCGFPARVSENVSISQSWKFSRYQQQALHYEDCMDHADKIACPGPTGQMFSWDIFESQPGVCWFGEEPCFEGSTTITQWATITPRDLGTLRDSAMSMTVSLECSHLNNTQFIEQQDGISYYNLGNTTTGLDLPNTTMVFFDIGKYRVRSNYRLNVFDYNTGDIKSWEPPDFLLQKLSSPYARSNISASSSMMLLFNSLYNVGSVYANSDPFFLTEATPIAPNYPGTNYEFRAGQPVATLVCRDRIQLELDPKKPPHANFKVAGSVSDVALAWDRYVSNQSVSWEWQDLQWDFLLLKIPLTASPLFQALHGLGGQAIRAQRSLGQPGLQLERPENVTTRNEVTRWFGVALLDVL